MWNCRILKPPLYCEIKTTIKPGEIGCLYQVRKSLKKSEEPISNHIKLLTTEHYMVKRVIYKLSNQLRSDKALKTLKQVHTCMKRLEGVNIVKQMKESIQLVEDRVSCNRDDTEYYFPSRQVLEYQLVTLQGIGALLRQTLQYCQKTFIHVRHHLEIGNLIPQNLLMLALISRIWYVCNSLGLYVCKWYGSLYSCLTLFKPTTVQWLQNEELPRDLTAWLAEMFKETDHPEQDIMENIEAEKASGSLPTSVQFLESADQEDVGEPIQRKSYVEESDNLKDKVSVATNQVNMNSNKRKIEDNIDDDDLDDESDDGEDIQISRKKKQKILRSEEKISTEADRKKMDAMEESDSNETHSSEDKDREINTTQESVRVNYKEPGNIDDRLGTRLPDVDVTNVDDVKAHLENVMQTFEDFNNCVEQIKCGTFKICQSCLRFSKPGKKKILKNIDKWKRSMKNRYSEELFLKKVRGPLSELIVKLNLIPGDETVEKEIKLNSEVRVDSTNKEESDLEKDSKGKKYNESEHVELTKEYKGHIGQETVSKNKQKRQKKQKKRNQDRTLEMNRNKVSVEGYNSKQKTLTSVKSKSPKKNKKK